MEQIKVQSAHEDHEHVTKQYTVTINLGGESSTFSGYIGDAYAKPAFRHLRIEKIDSSTEARDLAVVLPFVARHEARIIEMIEDHIEANEI